MERARIDGAGDDGGDDGMKMTLVGGVMRGANAEGVGLCHRNSSGNVGNGGRVGDDGSDVTMVGGAWDEMGVTIGGEMITTGPKEKIKIEEEEEGAESVPIGVRLLLSFLSD